MIDRPVRCDKQKFAIWYYYECGCAFEAVEADRFLCDTHRAADATQALLAEWLDDGRFLVANTEEERDLIQRSKKVLGQ